jgi:hypothetical protein
MVPYPSSFPLLSTVRWVILIYTHQSSPPFLINAYTTQSRNHKINSTSPIDVFWQFCSNASKKIWKSSCTSCWKCTSDAFQPNELVKPSTGRSRRKQEVKQSSVCVSFALLLLHSPHPHPLPHPSYSFVIALLHSPPCSHILLLITTESTQHTTLTCAHSRLIRHHHARK